MIYDRGQKADDRNVGFARVDQQAHEQETEQAQYPGADAQQQGQQRLAEVSPRLFGSRFRGLQGSLDAGQWWRKGVGVLWLALDTRGRVGLGGRRSWPRRL